MLHKENLKDAYEKEFGQAVKKYNEQQAEKGHPERQIEDYLKKINDDKQKNVLYEHIIQLGDRNTIGINKNQENIEVFREFVSGWNERNPNLHMVGAVVHRDEKEGSDHMHIFYFPVARDVQRGLEVQNGLKQALRQQGFETRAKMGTAQIQWQKTEKETLERIAKEHGFEIEHKHGDREHYQQETFKAYMEYEQAQTRLEAAREAEKQLDKSLDVKRDELDRLNKQPYQLPKAKKIPIYGEVFIAKEVTDTLQQADSKLKQAEKQIEVRDQQIDTYKATLGKSEATVERIGKAYNDLREKQYDRGYLEIRLKEVDRIEREQMPEHNHTRKRDRDEIEIGGR